MKRKYVAAISSLLLSVSLVFTGCGGKKYDNSNVPAPSTDSIDTSNMKNGGFYIYHNGQAYKPYFGKATFDEGNIASSSSKDRVMWFKEDDFANIPTMYKGDMILFYTRDDFKEDFTYERFKDLGYSIGLRDIKVLDSGRYSISTDESDDCTFPGGDTDELLLLNKTNDNVILESLGGTKLRTVEGTENDYSYLTDYGTIAGLEKDKKYAAQVYAGTVEHDYNFKADVEILGSMETYETPNYDFVKQYVVKVEFPDWFNSGYYMINGCGIFRYVNGTTIDNSTNYNIANVNPNADISLQSSAMTDDADTGTGINGEQCAKFTLDNPGAYTIRIMIKRPEGNEDTVYDSLVAYLETPGGRYYQFQNTTMDDLIVKMDSAAEGDYTVYVYGLSDRTATLKIEKN